MALKSKHWTESSTKDFIYRIASDFIEQIQAKLDEADANREELAKALGVSKGRVSQILNNPGNFTLKMIVKCARALGLKIAVVAYDDGDNPHGVVDSDIFRICWERAGKPADYWALDRTTNVSTASQAFPLRVATGPVPWLSVYEFPYSRGTIEDKSIPGFLPSQITNNPSIFLIPHPVVRAATLKREEIQRG